MTGMERLLRLRRGVQRDYSQTVEFPVEIVGRDGRVRRFSYDESVRLYQRRIRSAMLRFDDASEVDEEVLHCQQRIEQLRRSYLEYFAASTLQSGLSGSDSSVIGSSLGAEVASFLRRAFPEEVDGPPLMQCSVVERGVGDTIFVKIGDRSYLLYAWRIDGQGPAGAVEAWKKTRERLAGMPVMEGVERLLTAWQSGDCALLLTGAGELPDLSALDEIALPGSGDLFIDGMRALYDGHLGTAIGLFESGLEQQPGRRVLASSAALVALMDGQAERAAFNACVGRLHHAHDPLLRYIQALALCHQRSTARDGAGDAALCDVPNSERSYRRGGHHAAPPETGAVRTAVRSAHSGPDAHRDGAVFDAADDRAAGHRTRDGHALPVVTRCSGAPVDRAALGRGTALSGPLGGGLGVEYAAQDAPHALHGAVSARTQERCAELIRFVRCVSR